MILTAGAPELDVKYQNINKHKTNKNHMLFSIFTANSTYVFESNKCHSFELCLKQKIKQNMCEDSSVVVLKFLCLIICCSFRFVS